jgi:hypothetical protein
MTRVRSIGLLVLVAAILVPTRLAAADQPGAIPTPVDPGPFTVEGLCSFPVDLSFSGKTGELQLPGGRTLFFGGLTGTFTNTEDPSRSVTLNISGSAATTEGSDVTIAHGRSVLASPEGLVLIAGNFTLTPSPAGDVIEGNGTITPICPLIA